MKHRYDCSCGKQHERDYPIGKAKVRVKCDCGLMAKKRLEIPHMPRVLTKI